MRHLLAIIAVSAMAVGAAGCAPRPQSVSETAGQFVPITPLPQQIFATPDDVISHYLADTGRERPTTRVLDHKPSGAAQLVVVFSAEGYEDDSLAGEQWRIALVQADGGYRVIEAGKRFKCYRGGSSAWRTTLCP